MPARQSTQAVPDQRFPAPQETHAPTLVLPAGEVVPAEQAVQDATSPVEYVPSAHVEHEEDPAEEYLPEPQDVHVVRI